MELLQAFGIDTRLLAANLINFLILAGILYKLGYQPILKFVRERQEKIRQGLAHAADAAQKLDEAERTKKVTLMKAHQEAQEILARARDLSEAQSRQALAKTKTEATHIVERAKKEIRDQQAESLRAVKREAATLVVALAEKLLRRKVTAASDEAFIKDSIKELER